MIPPLVAIFAYPLVALILFRALAPRPALIWTILLGYLFLPSGINFDLPVLPAIDKATMPALAAIALMLAASPQAIAAGGPVQPGWWPQNRTVKLLLLIAVGGAFLTVLTNGDRLVFGPKVIPALRLYDGFSDVLGVILKLLPFLLARRYLATEADHRLLLRSLAIAGAIYSLPIIFELVMSPQLNRIVYGYFPHSWLQHIRNGGYRPLVFLQHGLWLGIFMSGTVLAAVAVSRVDGPDRRKLWLGLGAWLLLILINCKTLGATAITIVLLPAMLFLRPRTQILLAALVASAVLLYPMLRGAGLVPTDQAISLAEQVSPERAASLRFRVKNEDALLEKANQRVLFGWGGWGRSRLYDEDGHDVSTTDGLWVIVIGLGGWTGYVGLVGLLCLPVILLAFGRQRATLTLATTGLCLVLAGNLIDMIPNAGLTPVTWLVVGALCGRLERSGVTEADAGGQVRPIDRQLKYTRFDPADEPMVARPAHPHHYTRFDPDDESTAARPAHKREPHPTSRAKSEIS